MRRAATTDRGIHENRTVQSTRCVTCRREFMPRRHGHIYCSVKCGVAARRRSTAGATIRQPIRCVECGREFMPLEYAIQCPGQTYCCIRCGEAVRARLGLRATVGLTFCRTKAESLWRTIAKWLRSIPW